MPYTSAKPILITGVAGFIGAALAQKYLDTGTAVVGLDNMNDYYDPALKQARLSRLQAHALFDFRKIDLADQVPLEKLFATEQFEIVINMAAQAVCDIPSKIRGPTHIVISTAS